MELVRRLVRCKHGVTIVEYAILLALITLVSIGAISALGTAVHNAFNIACLGLHGDAAKDCNGTSPR